MNDLDRDLVILGGGITGLGIARMAARAGWPVTVIERDDLATGATGATSHMLHGGLRYLEHGRFSLVREALSERMAVSRLAPALSHPVRFMVPIRRGDRVGPWKLRAGLSLYDMLAGRAAFSPHVMADSRQAQSLEPAIEPKGLRGAGLYSDVVMDDTRLAIAVARDAAEHGAEILTRTELVAARPDAPTGRQIIEARRREGGTLTLRARLVVNATGAWSDRTRATVLGMLQPGASDPPRLLRPSRGTHLVYPALTRRHGLVTIASDGRVCFVVPFAGRSLVGTTEVETASPPSDAQRRPSADEIRYLAAEVARLIPAAARMHPVAVYGGVRPLLSAVEAIDRASREHRIVQDGALLTIVGGKYTTFRVMARDLVQRAATIMQKEVMPKDDATEPLPVYPADSPDHEAFAEHAIDHEWARTLEDLIRRRSARWLADDRGLMAARRMAPVLARKFGWDAAREKDEIERFEASVRDELIMLDRTLATR